MSRRENIRYESWKLLQIWWSWSVWTINHDRRCKRRSREKNKYDETKPGSRSDPWNQPTIMGGPVQRGTQKTMVQPVIVIITCPSWFRNFLVGLVKYKLILGFWWEINLCKSMKKPHENKIQKVISWFWHSLYTEICYRKPLKGDSWDNLELIYKRINLTPPLKVPIIWRIVVHRVHFEKLLLFLIMKWF